MNKMLIAFDSTQQALRAEMLLEYYEVEIDIRPTPKQITAGCALSIEFDGIQLALVESTIVNDCVEIRGLYYIDPDHIYREYKPQGPKI
jgi:hypothetical protein